MSEPHWTSNWASIDYKIQPFNMVFDLWSQSESTRSKRNTFTMTVSTHVNKQQAHSWTGIEPLVGWTTSTTQTYWGQYITTELIICLKHLTQTPRTPCSPVWDKRGLTKRRYLTSRGRRYLTLRNEKCWSHCWGNCLLQLKRSSSPISQQQCVSTATWKFEPRMGSFSLHPVSLVTCVLMQTSQLWSFFVKTCPKKI